MAPVVFDKIPQFDFDNPECRALLKKNSNILVGNVGKFGATTNEVENVELYRYLDLFVKGKDIFFLGEILGWFFYRMDIV